MRKQKYHINSHNEAKPCNATVYACRFSDSSHFETFVEAVQESERRLSNDNNAFNKLSKKKSQNKDEHEDSNSADSVERLRNIFKNFNMTDKSPDNLQSIGEVFNSELKNRLSFDPYEDELSKNDWDNLQKETHKLMGEIFDNGSDVKNDVFGTFAKKLNDAVAVLPDNVKDRLKETKILAKSIRKDAMDRDGMHQGGSRFFVNRLPEVREFSKYEKEDADKVPDGAYFIKGYSLTSDLESKGFGTRAAVKIDADHYQDVWVGARVSDSGKTLNNNAEVYINNGSSKKPGLIVSEIKDKYTYTGSIISAKKIDNENDQKSVLLHEYTHLVQQHDYSGAETMMFNKIKQDGKVEEYDPSQNMNVYKGFPDAYMGLMNGRELLTRATEGLFYPSSQKFLYGADKGENADAVRKWAAGYWISQGLMKNDD